MASKYQTYLNRVDGQNELSRFSNDPQMYNSALINEFNEIRQDNYPNISEQLDLLWHAIDAEIIPGKTSDFYTTLKTVKDTYPQIDLVED
tara:strand:- start:52 stop:321 length:270 start_codon:yes stop_codon:yes gene_type:complete